MQVEDYKLDQIIPDILKKFSGDPIIYDISFTIPYLVKNMIYNVTIKLERSDR